jgi:3-deoxy-D-manno-octulosonic-acid transferase
LGVSADRIIFAGNLKFDVEIPRISAEEAVQLRRELGLGQRVLVLGSSTWPGEEAALLAAWRRWRSDGMDVGLLLVPRHAERRPEIERLLVDQGVAHHFRSRGAAPGPVEVAVADTTGELRRLTQLADVVVVGKSLPPHTEGQTPGRGCGAREADRIWSGHGQLPSDRRRLGAAGGCAAIGRRAGLVRGVAELLMDAQRRAELARAAADWRRENAGATVRTLAVIRAELAALR